MYTHDCLHVCICTHRHVYTHFTRVHTHTLTHTATCICMCSHVCTYIHSQPSCMHALDAGTCRTVYVCSCVLTCMCAHSHTLHTHAWAHTNTCAHLHIAHTLAHSQTHAGGGSLPYISLLHDPPQVKNPQNLITKFREKFICFLDF